MTKSQDGPTAGTAPYPSARRLVIARDTRAAEEFVLARCRSLAEDLRREPHLLGTPVRILVPSGGLRDHLSARLASVDGAALAIQVQTLDALAREILTRRGIEARTADLLLDIFVRRAARQEPLLEGLLGRLEDGFAPLVAVVRDLLDAGLDRGTAEAFDEAIQALVAPPRRVERLRAICRVAQHTQSMAGEGGLLLGTDLFQLAAQALADRIPDERDPSGDPLPTRACLAVGFSDVTGRAAELLDAVARHTDTEFLLERPADVTRANHAALEGGLEQEEDRSARFSDRLRERIEALVDEQIVLPSRPRRCLTLCAAPGREAEVRGAATAIRALLDEGLAPERIALVAREMSPFRVALSVAFGRLGIPFSAGGTKGLADATTGRLNALVHLLERGEEASVDHWLDAQGSRLSEQGESEGGAALAESQNSSTLDSPQTRLALRVLGLARLSDVRELDLSASLGGRRSLELPLRRGADSPTADGQDKLRDGESATEEEAEFDRSRARAARGSRRRVSIEQLQSTTDRAGLVSKALGARPSQATGAEHVADLRQFVRSCLGWQGQERVMQRLELALSELSGSTHDEPLTGEEFVRLLARSIDAVARPSLGGRGGGVRVLGAMEARGHAFEHLFLIGLERGAFPRAGGEDPLMPDSLRAPLTVVLPELPVKARRRDEERFLFSGLCAAAEHVHLSHAHYDEHGAALLPSPLFTRVRDQFPGLEVQSLPTSLPTRFEDAFGGGEALPRTALEVSTLVALFAPRFGSAGREKARSVALREAGVWEGDRAELNRHRRAVLDEIEGKGPAAERPGPWFGLLGAAGAGKSWPDPWQTTQPVTAFERFASCGWQLFLERVLRLEPLPDPMAALATIDARQLGNTVHRALEAVALGDFPPPSNSAAQSLRPLGQVLGQDGSPPQWPASKKALFDLAQEAAKRELQATGLPLPGLVRGLGQRALPYLLAARERLGDDDPERHALGAEVSGQVALRFDGDRELELGFRIDRVDRVGSGKDSSVELIDYKTGKPWFTVTTPAKREEKTLIAIQSGAHLQGIVYTLGANKPNSRGRYLFLKEGLDPRTVSIDVSSQGDAYLKMTSAFRETARRIADAWRQGVFLPRLIEAGAPEKAKTNPSCSWCRVSEACNRGDSSAPRRLAKWEAADGQDEAGILHTAREAWNMEPDQ